MSLCLNRQRCAVGPALAGTPLDCAAPPEDLTAARWASLAEEVFAELGNLDFVTRGRLAAALSAGIDVDDDVDVPPPASSATSLKRASKFCRRAFSLP